MSDKSDKMIPKPKMPGGARGWGQNPHPQPKPTPKAFVPEWVLDPSLLPKAPPKRREEP